MIAENKKTEQNQADARRAKAIATARAQAHAVYARVKAADAADAWPLRKITTKRKSHNAKN